MEPSPPTAKACGAERGQVGTGEAVGSHGPMPTPAASPSTHTAVLGILALKG